MIQKLPDIFFLPEWGNLYQVLEKGIATVFEFKNETGHVYYQFIKRRTPDYSGLSDYFDIITPYGYSGPYIIHCEDGKKEQLISEYNIEFLNYCSQEKIIAEYVRFNPWLMNHLDFGNLYNLKYNNYTLFTDLTVNDFFMDEFHQKIRNKIRLAEKMGVTIEFDFTGSSLKEFYRLYQMTAEKNSFSDYYRFSYDFLYNTFKVLGKAQFIVNAKFENRYISSNIFLDYGEYLHYFLAGNDYEYKHYNGNSVILYETASWAKAHGKKQFHLGGAFSENLFAFKKNFTRKGFCEFFVGRRIINEHIYNKLTDIRLLKGEFKDLSYFPKYRG